MSEQPGQGDGSSGTDTGTAVGQGPGGPGEDPQRAGVRALWLGAGALVLSLFFFPIGLVLGIAAIVIAIKARRLAGGGRTPVTGVVPGIALAAVGLALAGVQLVFMAVLWPELSGRQECLASANTTTDETVCRDRFVTEVSDKLNIPRKSLEPYSDLF